MSTPVQTDMLKFVGALLVIIAQVVGIVKYMDAQFDSLEDKIEDKLLVLDEKVDKLDREMLRRERYLDLGDALKEDVSNIKTEVRELSGLVNNNFRNIFELKRAVESP